MTSLVTVLLLLAADRVAGSPDWCKYVPPASQQYVAECGGYVPATQYAGPAGAPDWCKWVPSASLQYVGQCSGVAPAPQGTGSDAGWGYGDGPDGCINWCVWVPGPEWHQRDECKRCPEYYPAEAQGYAHAGCEGWCQWVSQPSWQYVDNCRGCHTSYAKAAVKAQDVSEEGASKPVKEVEQTRPILP
eukprot:CAMPEP_0181461110 /NCGR_PEP_ID=MMETSP1110-20121109/33705_1 /TAXON_ID=174948 /ORGANISM="Symbiodinium sp., Strain CCMP421" /LENGTH=187 /DNA_ID=CAMNT_0023585717 /DNA_START=61 /DNA_END=624 /DNA_ORIENTATION=-